jgi:hypothetical protein
VLVYEMKLQAPVSKRSRRRQGPRGPRRKDARPRTGPARGAGRGERGSRIAA